MNPTSKFLKRKEAAEYLINIYGFGTKKTLDRLACEGGGPIITYLGTNRPRYLIQDLDAWIESKIRRANRATELSETADGEGK